MGSGMLVFGCVYGRAVKGVFPSHGAIKRQQLNVGNGLLISFPLKSLCRRYVNGVYRHRRFRSALLQTPFDVLPERGIEEVGDGVLVFFTKVH